MSLPRKRMLQAIKKGKRRLDIEDAILQIEFVDQDSKIGKHAEIFIMSTSEAQIMLYPEATFFTLRHELCHMKLFRMGIPVSNTDRDAELFQDSEEYLRAIIIIEWYINELQRRSFNEYYAIDELGTPNPPPFPELPKLPSHSFSSDQVRGILKIAKHRSSR